MNRFYYFDCQVPVPEYAIRRRTVSQLTRFISRLEKDHGLDLTFSFPASSKQYPNSWAAEWADSPGKFWILIAPHHRSFDTCCHEVAHVLTADEGTGHGPRFMREYIRLLARYARCDEGYLELVALSYGIKI